MLYRVIGSSKDTGARMVLEFHAESKAGAERKALQQGMNVLHVTDITDGDPGLPPPHRSTVAPGRTRSSSLLRKLITLVVVLAIAYVAYRYLYPRRASLRSSVGPSLFPPPAVTYASFCTSDR